MGSDIHYQLYETYFKKAVQAENDNKLSEAKQLYLLSCESLLKSAKQVDGNMKDAMIKRAEKIQKISDSIKIDKTPQDRNTVQKPEIEKEKSSDEQNIWMSSGKPNVHFSDIAGLQDVKDSINRRILLPRKYPEIYKTFNRKVSGGILLYGPPGTGKTMIAKAIACETDASFYSIRCSDIVGKYFGESEKNIKSLFETARKDDVAVIFFDEFEALAAQRGGDSSVMNRLVPELLSQMDGFQTEDSNIMILAATNRPWDIDSAFLRPPRLTEKIYVGLPDKDARLFLIEHAFDNVPIDPSIDMELIASLSEGFNAADVVSLCEAIKDSAIERSIDTNSSSEIIEIDIEHAKNRTKSSVNKKDLDLIYKWGFENNYCG